MTFSPLFWTIDFPVRRDSTHTMEEYLICELGVFTKTSRVYDKGGYSLSPVLAARECFERPDGTLCSCAARAAILWRKISSVTLSETDRLIVINGNLDTSVCLHCTDENYSAALGLIYSQRALHEVVTAPDAEASAWLAWARDLGLNTESGTLPELVARELERGRSDTRYLSETEIICAVQELHLEPAPTLKCSFCGEEVTQGDRYCINCGIPI